jgi:hypothetical protein
LFEQEQGQFNTQCSDIIYAIGQDNSSPVGLIDLIEQKQTGAFNIDYNKHIANLVDLYQKYDSGKLLENIKPFLLGEIADLDETKILSLKQAVYTINIKILEGESLQILTVAPDKLHSLLQEVILPRSFKPAIEKNITYYNNLLENPLFQYILKNETEGENILELLKQAISNHESEIIEPAIDLAGEESVNEFSLD